MKNLILLAIAVCFSTASFAQKGKLNAAKSAYKSGDYKAAYNAIEAASKHEKTMNLPETWVYKAQILSMLKMSPAVTEIMGITVDDSELTGALDKATELDAEGKYKAELTEAADVIINNTHNAGVAAYSEQKDYQAAVDLFSQKIKLKEAYTPDAEPDQMDYLIIGVSQTELGNKDEANKNFEKLMDLGYDDEAVYNSVINYYRDNKNDEMYIASLQKAQKQFPDNNNYKLLEIDHYIVSGKVDEVLPDMIAASEESPENVNLLLSISNVYKAKEDAENEKIWLGKALDVDPDNFGANLNLGALYFNQAVAHNSTMNYEMSTTTPAYIDAKAKRDELAAKAFPLFEKAYEAEPTHPSVLKAMIEYYRMYQKKDLQAKFQAEYDAVQ